MQYQAPKGLLFVKVGEEPYTRKNGTETTLAVWHAPCAREGCVSPVVIKTPLTNYQTSKSFLSKHCDNHKLTKAEVNARRVAARKLVHSTGNTKLSDQDVADIRASKLSAEGLSLIYPVCVRQLKEILSGRRR